MGRIHFKYVVVWLIALAVMQLAYVNCSKPVRFAEQNKASMGGGDGYSGKLYVVTNPGGLCPDGNPYLAQVEIPTEEAYLVRESCAAITPKQVTVVVSSVDSNFLAYGQ